MFDRNLLKAFDWGFLALIIAIALIGFIVLYSAVNAGGSSLSEALLFKQALWFFLGAVLMFVSLFINYKRLDQWGLLIYLFVLFLLLSVFFFGRYGGGARRWLALGPFSLQPSELMKIALCIVLARYFSRTFTKEGLNLRSLLTPFLFLLVPFVLIAKQPDLGTAIILFMIAASMVFFTGLRFKTFLFLLFLLLSLLPLSWFFLMGYQKERLFILLNPARDPLGAGYHIIQSKIAIGSGQLFGKGFLEGTQNALAFLPEQHTDFILSVLAEEWGFLACSLLLFLYLLFLAWGLNTAYVCKDLFGSFLAFGISVMNFWHIFINMGMVTGLLPVVGVPLPLISYGGSSVITTLLGAAILMNISMRRFSSD